MLLQELTGVDLFKIDPLGPYSLDYSECIEQAKQDQRRDARPELKGYPQTLQPYDPIYLGYPNYWGNMPMAVFAFLEKLDFTGKTIRPFCTHEGSGLGNSLRDIRLLCPHAKVKPGLAIQGAKVYDAKKPLAQWVHADLRFALPMKNNLIF